MAHTIVGRKLGMTQRWSSDDECIPVTVIKVGPCTVTRTKSSKGKDGYDAVQLGFEQLTEKKAEKKMNKPILGEFKKHAVAPHRVLREFRVGPADLEKFATGTVFSTEGLRPGYFVDVIGTSKGRGFAGVVKRHGFHGHDDGHGAHEYYRHPGTGGMGSIFPGRVPPGMGRPGHMGAARVTTQNLQIVEIDEARGLIYVKGAVPGSKTSLVLVREALKRPDYVVDARIAAALREASKQTGKMLNPLKAAKRAAKGG
jgi:large subunit ribosomal protein L3